MISVQALAVLAGACVASGSTAEPNFDLFVTNADAENHARTCYDTPHMPSNIQGTYIVSGPAWWTGPSPGTTGDYQMQGIFDGLAKANTFVIGNKKVCHASKWMNTSIARKAEEIGHIPGMLFEESVPPRPSCPMKNKFCESNVMVDNNWVNVIEIGGRVVMLSDTPHMLVMDLDTLDVTGNLVWSDDKPSGTGPNPDWASPLHAVASGSAHPIPFHNSNTYVDVVTEVMEGPGLCLFPPVDCHFLAVYTFESDVSGMQSRKHLRSLPFSSAPYLHSFGVTDNYIVLPLNQKIGVPNLFKPTLLGLIKKHWFGIYVLDKQGQTVEVFADMDEFVHVHVINSYEDDTGVVIDLGAYPDTPFAKTGAMDIKMFKNKGQRDSNPGRATLQRIKLHLTGPLKGQSEVTKFAGAAAAHADFYRMNPEYYGRSYCYFYATEWWHDESNYASMAIIKHNTCDDTQTYWTKTNFYPGEAFFLSNGGDLEDDGVVVFVAIDGERGASSFITLDAKTMTEIDGASVQLPFHIPFTAHGEFITDHGAITV